MWISWQQHVVCRVYKYSCMMITTWLMSGIDSYQSMQMFKDPNSKRYITFQRNTQRTLSCIGGIITYVYSTTATLCGKTRRGSCTVSLDKTNGLWTCATCKTSGISLFQSCCGKALSFDEVCEVIENEEEQMTF